MFSKISKFIKKKVIRTDKKCEIKNNNNEFSLEKNVLNLFSKIDKHFIQYNFADENYKDINLFIRLDNQINNGIIKKISIKQKLFPIGTFVIYLMIDLIIKLSNGNILNTFNMMNIILITLFTILVTGLSFFSEKFNILLNSNERSLIDYFSYLEERKLIQKGKFPIKKHNISILKIYKNINKILKNNKSHKYLIYFYLFNNEYYSQDLIKIIKDNNFETIVDYICSLNNEQILELSNKLKKYQDEQNNNVNKLLEEKLKNSNNSDNKNNEILKLIDKKKNLINLMYINKYYDNDDISKNLKEYELLSDIEKQLLKQDLNSG